MLTAPTLCFVTAIMNIVKFKHVSYKPDSFDEEVKYGPFSIAVGFVLAMGSLIWIPIYSFYYTSVQCIKSREEPQNEVAV